VSARAKEYAIRQLLQISSSGIYDPPNKLFVIPDDVEIQQIIHGLGGRGWGGIWVPNEILKIQISGRLRVGTVNVGFVSRKNITNIQEM
jgi:hypothetical protein